MCLLVNFSNILVMDSSARSTTGALRGSQFNLGNFRQCLSSRAPFPTQYCLVIIKANIPEPRSGRSALSIYYEPYESVLDKLYVSYLLKIEMQKKG